VCEPDEGAVILEAAVKVLHSGMDYAADSTIDVIRTDILQQLDNLVAGRLNDKKHQQCFD